MSLLDLSKVTKTVLKVIEEGIRNLPDGNVPPLLKSGLSVVPEPPDKLSGNYTVGMYLYHIKENADNKNLMPISSGKPAIRYTPMPLQLYYVMTAFSDLTEATFIEQQLMGFAMKALHDYPVITKNTTIGNTSIMLAPINEGDNRLQIELRPVDADNATTYWTAGNSPQRLACYYMVSTVLLEPEQPTSYSSRVLTYHLSTSSRSLVPRIDSSGSSLTYTYPGEPTKSLELRPAQTTFGNKITFEGSHLLGSSPTKLYLKHPSWPAPKDLPTSSPWDLQVTTQSISCKLQDSLDGNHLMPGTYEAYALVTQRQEVAPNIQKDVACKSNSSAFMIAPQKPSFTPIQIGTDITVTAKRMPYPVTAQRQVEVLVGDTTLKMVSKPTLPATLQNGEFFMESSSELVFRLPQHAVIGAILSFRLLVNGISSPPCWITVVS